MKILEQLQHAALYAHRKWQYCNTCEIASSRRPRNINLNNSTSKVLEKDKLE